MVSSTTSTTPVLATMELRLQLPMSIISSPSVLKSTTPLLGLKFRLLCRTVLTSVLPFTLNATSTSSTTTLLPSSHQLREFLLSLPESVEVPSLSFPRSSKTTSLPNLNSANLNRLLKLFRSSPTGPSHDHLSH